jgi:nitrilase
MTLQRFRVAALQMVSAPEVDANLRRAEALIAEAAAAGAQLVALPEYFCLLGRQDGDKVAVREADGSGPIQQFLAEAALRHGLWLIGGTLPLWCDAPDKVRNSCLVFDDQGQRRARYDKIHLFGFDNGSERFDEARSIQPGTQPVTLDSPFGRIGLSVCYDLRFPELYRALAPTELLMVPSAFTATTGRAHWEPLLRARAIENLAWVVAPAQGGLHPNGRRTHGHSMIIDPWGEIVAELAEGEGVLLAEIDHARLQQARSSLPALQHRVL